MASISPNLDQIRAILREFGYVIVPEADLKAAIANLGGAKAEREAKDALKQALNAT